MRRDTATYEELAQDQQRHWKGVAAVRDSRYQVLKEVAQRPWRCPTCGTGEQRQPICSKCRSARIVEIE